MASDMIFQSQLGDIDAKRKLAMALQGQAFDRGSNYSPLSALVDTLRANQGEMQLEELQGQQQKLIDDRQQRQMQSVEALMADAENPAISQKSRNLGFIKLALENPEVANVVRPMMAQEKTQKKLEKVGENLVEYDPTTSAVKELYKGDQKPQTEIEKLFAARDRATDPQQRAAIEAAIRKASTHAPANVVNVDMKGQSAFAKTLYEGDAKRVLEADESAQQATKALSTLNRLDQLNRSGQLFQGAAADQRVAIANFANTFGVPVDKKRLSNSQEYDAYSKELVTGIIKSLGANPSNADREFIEKTVPNLSKSPEAANALIQFMGRRAQQVIADSRAMREYGEKNNSLKGFSPPSLQNQQQQTTPKKRVYNRATGKMELE